MSIVSKDDGSVRIGENVAIGNDVKIQGVEVPSDIQLKEKEAELKKIIEEIGSLSLEFQTVVNVAVLSKKNRSARNEALLQASLCYEKQVDLLVAALKDVESVDVRTDVLAKIKAVLAAPGDFERLTTSYLAVSKPEELNE